MSPFNSTSGFNSSIITNATNAFPQASPGHSTNHALPLPPRLTPAFGLAGALLIMTSIPYALASIRYGRLYMSISCTYLVCIGITVIILFTTKHLDAGISDRAQGGYLVAAVLPAIIVGGLLQWFVGWLARRAGCVLGGFCMAMWIETLCPGGVIKTSSMTALLIGAMCAVSLTPSIPMLKKWADPAYMTFSAFSGSTAFVLGIDCYSRAGLKEFWAYTWHLHRVELFGFGTKTYPLTHLIIVENVLIPVLFVAALIIQYKFWKPLRARKEAEAARMAALREDQEKQALEIGRTFRMAADRDLTAWEARNKDPDPKKPDVEQKPVDPPSFASRAGQKINGVADFVLNKLKPDHNVLLPISSDARHQHHDEISPLGARKTISPAALNTSQTKGPFVISEGVPDSEEVEARIPSSVIPILERLMVENGKALNENGEEVEYTLRPTSKRPPPILPAMDYECGSPWDETEDANMRSISPSPPALAARFSFLNSASDLVDTTEQPRDVEESHEDEGMVPTVITLSEDDLSEWEQHITRTPNVDERNANKEHSTPEDLEPSNETLRYAHLGPASEVFNINEAVEPSSRIPNSEAHGRAEVMSRTQEWSKNLVDAEPNLRASSVRSYDAKDETILWKDFEGTYATKGSAERLEEDDLAASQSQQQHGLSQSSALKKDKGKSRCTSDIEDNSAILPMPIKSARVSKHNLSLPVLDTGVTLLDTAAARREVQKKQRCLSVNFAGENQGIVARRYFGSHGKLAESSSDLVESTDLDEITLSQARKTLHTRAVSNSQGSSIYSHGPYTSSSMSGQSPADTTARTTPVVSSPVYVSPTTSPSGPSPTQNCPPFVMVAPPLRNPYPLPPCESFQPSAPPYWYSNGAFSPGHSFAPDGINEQPAVIPEDADFRLPQRRSAPGAKPTLMARVEFDEHSRRKAAERQLLEQRRGMAAEAAKAKQRDKQQRRRTLEIEGRMRAGQLDNAHANLISKMQRQAMRNIEKQNNKNY
ncbi:hypothetical protein M436DRAFT_65707 [Aureobasidium namibiae CBS 147.97]|uniref:TM7S3/TM198-like domain-containing protein n=1 Tax=Aureobasidium namibiae CBS 147.97 TaxID=1043004 RepID=A0A074WCM0_9PEZI